MNKYSICILGDRRVGKTTVAKTISEDKIIEQSPINIFVTTYHSKVLEFWDFSGNPKYSSLRKLFYKHFNGYMLVFDMSNRNSFKNLKKWEKEIKSFCDETDSPKILVGTKQDLGVSEKLNREFTTVFKGQINKDEWEKFFARVLATDNARILSLNADLDGYKEEKSHGLISRVRKWWQPQELPLTTPPK